MLHTAAPAAPLRFTCSFDDGHPADLRTAALLARHGIPATFYVPVRNREGAPVLARGALRELAQAFEIGSHTLDHHPLRPLAPGPARLQVVQGKQRLEQVLGRPVDGFCYPAGKYRRAHVAIVRAAGFRWARSTVNLCTRPGHDPWQMPTTLQFYPHRADVYLRNAVRGGRWPERLPALALLLATPAWPRRLYALFDHALQRGGVFHLWGHSKDLDELQAWDELDAFLAHVARSVAPAGRLSNGALAAQAWPASGMPSAAAA